MHPTLATAPAPPRPTSRGLSKNGLARISGALYLALFLSGIFSIVYVPAILIDWNDPATTIANIKASESLFRFGIIGGLFCQTCLLVLSLTLFELFKSVNKRLAQFMLVLALVGVPVAFAYFTNYVNILTLLSGAHYFDSLPTEVLHAQVMYLLSSFGNGYLVTSLFSGLWLLPLGLLAYQSGFVPKTLGVLLVFACFGYVAEFIAKLAFSMEGIPVFISILSSLGEFGTCLWLLLFGARSVGKVS